VEETGRRLGVRTKAEAVDRVDALLKECEGVVVTADAAILDSGVRWFDLAEWTIRERIPGAWIVDLGPGGRPKEEKA
jgi:hypothetical protein